MTPSNHQATPEIRHIPWAFSLEQASRLPLTGDQHPLRRELARWLTWANLITLILAGAAGGSWVWYSHRQPPVRAVAHRVKIVRYTDLGVPPSIARPTVPQINVAEAVAKIAAPPPSIAVPEPVADEKAQVQTIATQTQMAEEVPTVDLSNFGTGEGTGDSLSVDIDLDTSPAPTDFIMVDQEPVRLSIDAPVFPPVARGAGIEGSCLVQVLVGKDGKVKDAIVVDGPDALRQAADDCARTAVFRPALIDQKPVEVWVVIPITFKLRG